MTKHFLILFIITSFVVSGCHSSSNNTNTVTSVSCSTYGGGAPSGSNYMTISAGAGSAICGQNGYINEPCTSVTICNPGTGTCQTISDILVDTGSFGLRIFRSAMGGITPTAAKIGGNTVGECAQFGTANEWGQVESVDMTVPGEATIHNLPIQVIDSSYASVPSPCTNPAPGSSPIGEGFNGILGVGLFTQDCGSYCQTTAANQMYYSCSGATCTNVAYPITSQVVNPVAMITGLDNNGVLVEMPAVPTSGAANVTGYLIMGIGTQADNTPSKTTTFPADPNLGVFTVTYAGATYDQSFIDSGSNGLFFPGSLAACPSNGSADGFFCPTTAQNLTATNQGVNGSPTAGVSFQVANALDLLNTGNEIFTNMAGSNSDFDWGLPFFLGCKVYVGVENKSSSLGTGPYWSY